MPSVSAKWTVLIVIVVLAACAPPQLPGNLTTTEPFATTTPQPSALVTPANQTPLIEQVIADLAARLGTAPSEIKIVTQETVTWPDRGLGCPEPGIEHIQIPVDGLRIVLSHGGTIYEYHTGASRLVWCETTLVKPTLTPLPFQLDEALTPAHNLTATLPIESGLQPLIDTAIPDLADRLSIDHNTIEVVGAQSVVWPDQSLGCPQPGMVYLQDLAEGFRIELRVKDHVYAYHGGAGRDLFLCENPLK
jgi:hypothetical protein